MGAIAVQWIAILMRAWVLKPNTIEYDLAYALWVLASAVWVIFFAASFPLWKYNNMNAYYKAEQVLLNRGIGYKKIRKEIVTDIVPDAEIKDVIFELAQNVKGNCISIYATKYKQEDDGYVVRLSRNDISGEKPINKTEI